jgi:branched-chain amino acid transport system permease protein
VLLAGLAVFLALPEANVTDIDTLIILATTAVLALTWNWTAGGAGLLNMAHIAYYAIGAYACALAVMVFNVHPAFGMAAGMALAAFLAWGIAFLSLRLRISDLYFALLTLTLAEALAALCRGVENEYMLGGFNLPLRNAPWQFAFFDKEAYYYALAVLAVGLAVLQWAIQRSRFGLLIEASRESERAASAMGVPVSRVLSVISVASAAPAALVGSIIALASLFVTADNVFRVDLLLMTVIAAVVGGIGSLWGPFLGAGAVLLVQQGIYRTLNAGSLTGITDVAFGVVLIAVIVLAPQGLAGLRRLRRRG